MYDEKNYPVGLRKKYVLGTTATLTPDFSFYASKHKKIMESVSNIVFRLIKCPKVILKKY